MAILNHLNRLIEICHLHEIENVILCPGSRSAALTIGFVRHSRFNTYSISDERSAAFIGLGIAQATKKPTILVCTSGTAAYNFSSAVAEAYFQEIPLIVLTADRPVEWIHQYDGQTIFQQNIYGNHVKKAYQLNIQNQDADSIWYLERIVNEAINICQTAPFGPVHLNIPIKEPFYPNVDESLDFPKDAKKIVLAKNESQLSQETWNECFGTIEDFDKILIAVGQSDDEELNQILGKITDELWIPVLADSISNISNASIKAHDLILPKLNEQEQHSLRPQLLITSGKSFISKNIKTFLRKNKALVHWHIQENEEFIDPFQSLTHKFNVNPVYFFKKMFEDLDYKKFLNGDDDDENSTYFEHWRVINEKTCLSIIKKLQKLPYSELNSLYRVINKLPENSIFQLGNSMSIRYVNLMQNILPKNIQVFCNRGTSGIEGSLSIAVGYAISTDKIVTCLLGDVSFFYDRNALWNNYLPSNLRIIVLNNGGGNIFRMIDGPAKQPELKEYFETHQNMSIENTIKDTGFEYYKVASTQELEEALTTFFEQSNSSKVIELFTDSVENQKLFNEFKES